MGNEGAEILASPASGRRGPTASLRSPWLGRALAAATVTLALAAGPGVALAQNPVGAHSMLQVDDPPSFMQAMFEQAAEMHASAIRLDVAPALIFPSPSQPPDFSGLDEVVSLARTYHLRVLADLMTVPTWMAECETPRSDASRCATTDLADYASVISRIVSRADPVIRDWEVWNEPDTAAFFDGTPQQYAFMLRAAHDAIKAVDPGDDVLLGGISGLAGMSWVTQVLQTPGADAAHAFDTANVHERADLWSLAPDLASWRQFFAANGFTGPLWVTEHGYPSDGAYQYDPGYTGGEAAQAAYLAASIPTLVDAGASEVFVTERDNLGGQFGSEGVLGGEVSDPPAPDPQIVRMPSFAVVQRIADCYLALGRDCPAAPAVAAPVPATMPPVPPGRASTRFVTVNNPGAEPIVLDAATIGGPQAAGLSVAHDGCAGEVLEPRQTCAVSLLFAPTAAGDVVAQLDLGTDGGALDVPVSATAPSVSALRSARLSSPTFVLTRSPDGVGYPQRWVLMLTNPLGAPVSIARSALSGPDARRFRIRSDRCAHATVAPHRSCHVWVSFTPTRAGVARAQLTLNGTGIPLTVQLRPVAFPLPTVTRLAPEGRAGCALPATATIAATTNQPATLHWTLRRARLGGGRICARATPPAGPPVAAGAVSTRSSRAAPTTGRSRDASAYPARWGLDGHGALHPGAYVLTVGASDAHGTGPARSITVAVRS